MRSIPSCIGRHRGAYHLVDPARLLSTATKDLPPLREFVKRILDEEKKA